MASREGDGRQDGRHRREEQPRPARAPFSSRDVLTPLGAQRATRFTRWTFAVTDVTYGLGFLLGAPTNSATYRAMQTATAPLLGDYNGMWLWGVLLIAAGLLIPLGQIAAGGPIGVFAWSGFAVFNLLSLSGGAWGFPLFAGLAVIHIGMSWYIVRDRRARARTARQQGRRPRRASA